MFDNNSEIGPWKIPLATKITRENTAQKNEKYNKVLASKLPFIKSKFLQYLESSKRQPSKQFKPVVVKQLLKPCQYSFNSFKFIQNKRYSPRKLCSSFDKSTVNLFRISKTVQFKQEKIDTNRVSKINFNDFQTVKAVPRQQKQRNKSLNMQFSKKRAIKHFLQQIQHI